MTIRILETKHVVDLCVPRVGHQANRQTIICSFGQTAKSALAHLDKSAIAQDRACAIPNLRHHGVRSYILIISFASSKGGVGKSTCCAAIAANLAKDGDRVLVLDLDLNQTVARWGRKSKLSRVTVEAVAPEAFTNVFRARTASKRFDHILIDLAGTREATLLKAMARSDLVIIPAQASEPDLREALVIIDDIADVIEAGAAKLDYRLLLTKLFPLPTRVTAFAHQEIKRHKIKNFKAGLVERAAYREMFLTGKAPSEAAPNGKAAQEIAELVDEIRDIVEPDRKRGGRAA